MMPHSYLGSASHQVFDSPVRVFHISHTHADRNETVKTLLSEAAEKQKEQKATSPTSCSQRFHKSKSRITTLATTAQKKAQMWIVWQVHTPVWPN